MEAEREVWFVERSGQTGAPWFKKTGPDPSCLLQFVIALGVRSSDLPGTKPVSWFGFFRGSFRSPMWMGDPPGRPGHKQFVRVTGATRG